MGKQPKRELSDKEVQDAVDYLALQSKLTTMQSIIDQAEPYLNHKLEECHMGPCNCGLPSLLSRINKLKEK